MIWIRANDKGLKFNVTIDPRVPTVLYGDEVRIKQVIVNLLNNAVKYTAKGSVELHVESEEKDEKTVELSISIIDTGMGIRKEAIPYLFDAFKRVDEEKNRHIEGTGLGLSIVKQLVDLMGGTITVNSVYGEGSTFTVVLTQGISDRTQIGDLNIHNQNTAKRSTYECSFRAPEAKLLIVDDNEMNLEVESKLLADTDMMIDKALSGREALELSLRNRYDTILMDHLMPQMDGIECLEKLRNQVGGLNRATPVVVLTANAGSANRELYNRAGFDGYLVKPVSGEALENVLLKFISPEKLAINSNKMMSMSENINTSAGYSGKMPVIITASSGCDLPAAMIKKLNLPILPFKIRTEEGVFKDGVQMSADELLRYLGTGKEAISSPPAEAEYADFFSNALKRAHHLIHIALTSDLSEDYMIACEAAKSFDNVTVINSECLSSATGLLVLIANKLAQMNMSVEDIVAELERVKHRLRCSFVMDTTEYMRRSGRLSPTLDRIARSVNLHPCIRLKEDRSGLGGGWLGERKRAYRKYIAAAFPVDVIPDPEIVFVTYADVPVDTLMWIKEEISKHAYFEHVVFKQASAAISSNCGPGTFGVLYFVKSNKSYNLSSYVEEDTGLLENDSVDALQAAASEENEETKESVLTTEQSAEDPEPEIPSEEEKKAENWYDQLEGIDGRLAIQNSGSEESFKTVLKIFYDSIDGKSAELEKYYAEHDWENYTIKVHALKSSAKLIGAADTAKDAQQLENAGKEERIDYILEHHEAFMKEYLRYKDTLSVLYEKKEEEEKPEADEYLMESVYEGLRDAAEAMDCDSIEEVFQEMEGYAIPEKEREKYDKLCELADNFDYDGILEVLKS